MLAPVAFSHLGFRAPGLLQDGRGVVVGSQAAILVVSLDRLVTLLRLISEERVFADLLPSLHIDEVKNPLEARGYLLRFACTDSRLLDRCAAAAALSSSTLCVGADRHFVAYRDRRAPLGYDVVELSTERGDYVLYTATATQAFFRVAEVALANLLSRLQLLPQPGGRFAALESGALVENELWLLLPAGLLPRILRFLWQRGVSAEAAPPDPLPPPTANPSPNPSSNRLGEGGLALLRLRPRDVTVAHLRLLLELPGVRALIPQSSDGELAVELGYVHPLRLPTFERLFDKGRRHLFLATAAGRFAEALSLPATPFLPAERLIELFDGTGTAPLLPVVRAAAFGDGPLPLRLPLRLVSSPTPREPPAATLIPWTQSRTLGRLLSTLSAPLLGDLRAACIDEGILLVGDSASLSCVPLGRLFYAAAPSVLVPLGGELLPRLRGELLRAKLGAEGSRCIVFLDEPSASAAHRATPIALGPELFQPIGGALVTSLSASQRQAETAPAPRPSPTVVNDSLGVFFSLWGRAGTPKGPDER